MGKTTYSLILADDVVALVDALAAREGYSRSALVNHILAEYVSHTTPEQTVRLALKALGDHAGGSGFRVGAASGTMLTLKTALPYKYNPALCYSVELWGEGENLGRLRVSLRSQNEALLGEVHDFFRLWQQMESRYLPTPPGNTAHQLEEKRYSRTLRRPRGLPPGGEVGETLGRYINLLDNCFKLYFQYGSSGNDAATRAERYYRQGVKDLGEGTEL